MPGKTLNIAIARIPLIPATEEQKKQIQSVSPHIKISDISSLVKGLHGGTESREALDPVLSKTEIFFGSPLPENILSRAPKLKWIQSPIAGIEQFLIPEVKASNIVVTKARIHDEQISETVFCMMLMLARQSLTHFRAQQMRKKVRVEPVILHGKTIGILGLGNIGLEVAKLAKAFDMKVLATKAHPQGKYKNIDVVLPPSGLPEVLKQSDFLIVLLPKTPDTVNLIGIKELSLMKPTSFLINVSRGGIVDEDALALVLKQKVIAGAGLDVFASDPGPLPPESKLWELENLIITPHNAGQRPDYSELIIRQFCLNLKRYIRGRELVYQVNKQLGY